MPVAPQTNCVKPSQLPLAMFTDCLRRRNQKRVTPPGLDNDRYCASQAAGIVFVRNVYGSPTAVRFRPALAQAGNFEDAQIDLTRHGRASAWKRNVVRRCRAQNHPAAYGPTNAATRVPQAARVQRV